MKAGQNSQPLPLAKVAQLNQGDEGGLDLGQVLGAIRRRVLLIAGITIVVASGALLKALSETPVYQASFEILTEPVTGESQLLSSVPQTLSSEEKVGAVGVDETKLQVLQSSKVLLPIVKQLQTRYPNISYQSVIGNLGIKTLGKNTNILQVTYQNSDPELVQAVLNLVAKAYLDYSLEERQIDIRRGIKFVEEQLPQLRSRVEAQQQRLQRLRQQYNLVDPETKGQQLSSQIAALGQQQLDTQVQLNEAQARYAKLQSELPQGSTKSATSLELSENPRYQRMLDRLQELDTQIAKESARFQPESPTIEDLRQQRQNLLPLLTQEEQRVQTLLTQQGQRDQGEMASSIQELEVRNQTLTQYLADLQLQVKQLSVISRTYNDIMRELNIATENLNQFLTKREALRIDAAQKQVPWQLLSPVGKPQPSVANVKNNLLLGAMLGLLLGMAAALLLEKLSNVIYTSKEVKNITKLPLLGIIPFKKELREFASEKNEAFLVNQANSNLALSNSGQPKKYKTVPFFEAFRSLYTNIRLLGSDTRIRSFVISSATSLEGKSTIAAHLAQAAATMGQQVLLVDTDLRNPCLHERLGLRNIQGLTDLISTELEFENAVQRSPLEDNLFILTAGPIPPDPVRLLASHKMQDLMNEMQAGFDLVIYDAPPLLGFADSYLVAAHTNGLVLVTGLGKLKRSVLEQALDELKVSTTPILGVVANMAKDTISSSSSSYQDSKIAPKSRITGSQLIIEPENIIEPEKW
ncbi:MAG: polysaccharide biosynthesis tyrosine autokinase [Aphanothece sp. CMT-3BRIN-NPC111]|jgi:capsular exopolysaccharide synthesis family protein|nr:polysaccharide biosynthesis tyrosine autokinase [Aphanothece sp. CMT-3BRIN-NPC111]